MDRLTTRLLAHFQPEQRRSNNRELFFSSTVRVTIPRGSIGLPRCRRPSDGRRICSETASSLKEPRASIFFDCTSYYAAWLERLAEMSEEAVRWAADLQRDGFVVLRHVLPTDVVCEGSGQIGMQLAVLSLCWYRPQSPCRQS